MAQKNRASIGIIGGGISGLTAGVALKEYGYYLTVYERRPAPGGVIRSCEQEGWLVELGPNTLMTKTERLWKLIDKLGLTSEILEAGGKARKRFIVKNGHLVPLPTSPIDFITSSLLSAGGKLRLLKEPFVPKGAPDQSVSDFFSRRLGREVEQYLVNPFVAGIYAGDPKKLSMRHSFTSVSELEQEYGSLVMGAMKFLKKSTNKKQKKRLISFRRGIGQLTEAMAEYLGSSVQFSSAVSAVSRDRDGWQVELNGSGDTARHDALIFTAPLHKTGSIQFEMAESGLFGRLKELRYAPIAIVATGFQKEQIKHPLDGFGFLVPEMEDRDILGGLFSSSLFTGRAPEGHHLLTCFVGGERNPGLVEKPEADIKALVLKELQSLLGCSGTPVFEQFHRWTKAIPQYTLDHQSHLNAMSRLEESNPGFYLTGNFRHEVSTPGCIQKAYETADRVASFLQSKESVRLKGL